MSLLSFQDIITSVTGIVILVTLILTFYIQPASTAGGEAEDPGTRLSELQSAVDRMTESNRALSGAISTAQTAPGAGRLEAEIDHLRIELERAGEHLASLDAREAGRSEAEQARRRELGLDRIESELGAMTAEVQSLESAARAAAEERQQIEARLPDLEERHQQAQRNRRRLWLIPEADTFGKQAILVVVSGTGISIQPFDDPAPARPLPAPAEAPFSEYLRSIRPQDVYVVFFVRPSGIPQFGQLRDLARGAGFETGYDPLEEDAQLQARLPPEEGPP